ncbi:hypothetical protein GCM10027261_05890 [Geodermatophilus arenarius]|uniref:Zinc-binding dehydrogenase n=1 Tax=Geodermatophilus arenarius TaxID=1137990 RepID=A0ABV9LDL5_9ACTN
MGRAAEQLAKRRGATVTAVCSAAKAADVLAQGADRIVDRGEDLVRTLGRASVDVVMDLVGGAQFPQWLDLLRPGGRYAIAGAIGGPIAEIDLRTLYLKDLSLLGCTFQEDEVFENPIEYVERAEVRPVVSRTYPLAEIALAQEAFPDEGAHRKAGARPTRPRCLREHPATAAAGQVVGEASCSRSAAPRLVEASPTSAAGRAAPALAGIEISHWLSRRRDASR